MRPPRDDSYILWTPGYTEIALHWCHNKMKILHCLCTEVTTKWQFHAGLWTENTLRRQSYGGLNYFFRFGSRQDNYLMLVLYWGLDEMTISCIFFTSLIETFNKTPVLLLFSTCWSRAINFMTFLSFSYFIFLNHFFSDLFFFHCRHKFNVL